MCVCVCTWPKSGSPSPSTLTCSSFSSSASELLAVSSGAASFTVCARHKKATSVLQKTRHRSPMAQLRTLLSSTTLRTYTVAWVYSLRSLCCWKRKLSRHSQHRSADRNQRRGHIPSRGLPAGLGSRRAAELTGLGGVLSGGSVGGARCRAMDGDLLVHNEEPADDLPLAGPEQSYTEHHKAVSVRQRKHPTPVCLDVWSESKLTAARLR